MSESALSAGWPETRKTGVSEELNCLIWAVIWGALMCFFFRAARACGKPVPRSRRAIDPDEGPFVGPWGILESRKRDPDLEWDEIAIIEDLYCQDEEDARDEDEDGWLSEPDDSMNDGWTNLDYFVAEEMEDYWDDNE